MILCTDAPGREMYVSQAGRRIRSPHGYTAETGRGEFGTMLFPSENSIVVLAETWLSGPFVSASVRVFGEKAVKRVPEAQHNARVAGGYRLS